ncbi:hypothetical protein LJC74_04385 [Eubacteriales bacterium OttesenSCG-928-A19]|nr:hypothetical protein [Eubacteriales bacterium OttesenSCG-928-A19]
MTSEIYNSQYGKVEYMEKDSAILLTWKKKCSYDDYRNTTLAALTGLKQHHQSNLIIDARKGFEDEPDDVQWAFQVLLPSMSETSCKTVVFIMNTTNDIEEEMDMWTKEFMKYFKVARVDSYEKAIAALSTD